MTIGTFKQQSVKLLSQTSPSAQLDTEVLLEHKLGFSKTQLLMNRDKELSSEELEWLNDAVEKRLTGLPVAYITGWKEFYGYEFHVTPAVLIPKPDTEILVERAVEIILEKMETHPNQILTVCDMCTGSGCIAIAVLRTLIDTYKIPQERLPKFTLIDISEAALEVARINGKPFESRLRYVRSNLFMEVPYTFDVILTNPPYIPHSLVNELLKDGRNEPRLALDGDVTLTGDCALTQDGSLADDGLEIIRNLFPQAYNHLSPFGAILMETGEYNAQTACNLAKITGFKDVRIIKDLEGQLRVTEGWK